MFALASLHVTDSAQKEHNLQVGADLTKTCHESYIRTGTHIILNLLYYTTQVNFSIINIVQYFD